MEKMNYNIEYVHIYADDKGISIDRGQRKSIEMAKRAIDSLEEKGKSYNLSLLVDNYNSDANKIDEDLLYSKLEERGVPPDYIVYESRLAEVADSLIEMIRSSYLKREYPNKVSFETKSNNVRLWAPDVEAKGFKEKFLEGNLNEKNVPAQKTSERDLNHTLAKRNSHLTTTNITLKYTGEDGSTTYTCPLLTACWHLAKLAVEPFDKVIKDAKKFSSKSPFGNRLLTIISSQYLKIESTVMEIISLASSDRIKKNKEKLEYRFF